MSKCDLQLFLSPFHTEELFPSPGLKKPEKVKLPLQVCAALAKFLSISQEPVSCETDATSVLCATSGCRDLMAAGNKLVMASYSSDRS